MKRSWILLLMIISQFVLFSCGGGGGSGGGSSSDDEETNISSFKFIDISGAKSLFITSDKISSLAKTDQVSGFRMPQKEISSSNTKNQACFKINENGDIIEINIKSESNNSLRINGITQVPTLIAPVNKEYLIIGFSDYNDRRIALRGCFLVNKSNGKVSKLADTVYNYWILEQGDSESLFQTDNNKCIYYISIPDGFVGDNIRISKVNLLNSEYSYVTPPEHHVGSFIVNGEGSIIYFYNTAKDPYMRAGIITADGRKKSFSCDYPNYIWVGDDGNFYYFLHYYDNIYTNDWVKKIMKINLTNLEPELFLEDVQVDALKKVGNKIYFVGLNEIGEIDYEMKTVSPKPILPNIVEEAQVDYIYSTDSYIYVARSKRHDNYCDLVKINPGTGDCERIFYGNQKIRSFAVSNSGDITFVSKTENGKNVINKISTSGGAERVLYEINGASILTLQPMEK